MEVLEFIEFQIIRWLEQNPPRYDLLNFIES